MITVAQIGYGDPLQFEVRVEQGGGAAEYLGKRFPRRFRSHDERKHPAVSPDRGRVSFPPRPRTEGVDPFPLRYQRDLPLFPGVRVRPAAVHRGHQGGLTLS